MLYSLIASSDAGHRILEWIEYAALVAAAIREDVEIEEVAL